MKRHILLSLLLTIIFTISAQASRHLILSGGPALRQWEDLRPERDRHDRWWANFIRAATMHMDNIRAAYGPNATLVWMLPKTPYIKRSREDNKPYIQWIRENAAKRKARIIWVESSSDIIRAINSQPANSITTFDFFGHSNKHCFLLDYSNDIIGASTIWLHKNELHRLSRRPFTLHTVCKSWGCHTGESMSQHWRNATGVPMVGARGKTDYSALSFGKMPAINGSWTQ